MKNSKDVYHYVIISVLLFVSISLFYFYLYGAEITGRATTATQVGNLTLGVQTLIACTWPSIVFNVSFGANLDPGTNDINATRNWNHPNSSFSGVPVQDIHNGTSYNITVDTLSNVQTNVTIRGLHFLSGANIIGIGNVTWAGNSTRANGTNMVPSQSNILSLTLNATVPVGELIAAGSTAWYRLWIDIPSGQAVGTYSGNYTQQCAQGV